MLTWDAWNFPDGERHLPVRMRKFNIVIEGRQTYQYPLYQQGLKVCRARRVAVDVGAHVGLFSFWMVRDFARVIAFEPVEAHRECWRANVPARDGDVLNGCALGATVGSVRMQSVRSDSSGGTFVAGPGDVPLCTLDSFDYPIVDLLKIDVEGYELEVVRGAVETLQRCRPAVIVEQRPRQVAHFKHRPAEAVTLLQRLGARIAWTDQRDYVVTWR